MGLTMSQRQAVTKTIAVRYKRASQVEKGTILDELCATTGWHRNHARKAPGQGLRPMVVRPRRPRVPKYGEDVVVGLRFCWAVLGAPTGKRLAPVMGELVATLRRFGPGPAREPLPPDAGHRHAPRRDRRPALGGRRADHAPPVDVGDLLNDEEALAGRPSSRVKIKRGQRLIPIDAETVAMLRRQRETQNLERATGIRHEALPGIGPEGGPARHPAPRPTPHQREPGPVRRRRPEGGLRAAGPLAARHHRRPLHPRQPGTRQGGSGADRQRAEARQPCSSYRIPAAEPQKRIPGGW